MYEIVNGDDYFQQNFLLKMVGTGLPIPGYYEDMSIMTSIGDAEIVVRMCENEEGLRSISGVDTHCGGACVWELVSTGKDLTPRNADRLTKRIVCRAKKEGIGKLPVNIINADVLPSFLEGQEFRLQMIGLPFEIHYHEDEAGYHASIPVSPDGNRYALSEGSLIPRTAVTTPENDDVHDQISGDILFYGKVIWLGEGTVDLGDDAIIGKKTFIRCAINTMLGPLEINHSIEQVPESDRANIRVGSLVSGLMVLSGDAAIYEYQYGFVQDEEHDEAARRYAEHIGDEKRIAKL